MRVFDTTDIEAPSFEINSDPTVECANYISTGGGPAGLSLDESDCPLIRRTISRTRQLDNRATADIFGCGGNTGPAARSGRIDAL